MKRQHELQTRCGCVLAEVRTDAFSKIKSNCLIYQWYTFFLFRAFFLSLLLLLLLVNMRPLENDTFQLNAPFSPFHSASIFFLCLCHSCNSSMLLWTIYWTWLLRRVLFFWWRSDQQRLDAFFIAFFHNELVHGRCNYLIILVNKIPHTEISLYTHIIRCDQSI